LGSQQVLLDDNAYQGTVLVQHGQVVNVMLAHQFGGLAVRGVGQDGDRVRGHSVFDQHRGPPRNHKAAESDMSTAQKSNTFHPLRGS